MKARGQMFLDVGDYYLVNERLNVVWQKDVDLEDYAREIGCLQPWEAVQS